MPVPAANIPMWDTFCSMEKPGMHKVLWLYDISQNTPLIYICWPISRFSRKELILPHGYILIRQSIELCSGRHSIGVYALTTVSRPIYATKETCWPGSSLNWKSPANWNVNIYVLCETFCFLYNTAYLFHTFDDFCAISIFSLWSFLSTSPM